MPHWPLSRDSGFRRCPNRLLVLIPLALLAGCSRPPLNVLLVTLDTTRADHLGCYGYSLARTPRLDALAREGVRCADAVSAAPITLPSHATILTGLYPPAHGVRDNGSYALGDDAVTLAERLKKAGYRTQAIVSALVLNRRYNLGQGFDGYDDDLWSEDEAKLFMIRSRPGDRTAERAAAWLDGWSKEKTSGKPHPFFLWMHLFDAHQPYRMAGTDRVLSPTPYDAEIAVLDRSVGRVLDELKKLGALDNTLVIVTADHGESLGEHGEKTHAVFIYDATVRVPLLLRCPRLLPSSKVYTDPVRSVDLVPTILSALGLPGGNETQGVDLLPALRGDVPAPQLPQYSESLLSEVGFGMAPLYGVRLGGFKWIRAPKPEVYDLARDPQELTNLYPAEARRGAALDRDLAAILDDSRRRALAPQKSPMDKETIESLQALGYLAPRASREAMQGIDPKDGMVLYEKLEDARHLAQDKKWPESEKLLRELLRETPNNVTAVNILALVLVREGDFAAARTEYLHALALDPKQSRVHAMLGTLSLLTDDLDAAERSYRRALEITPGFVEAISNLGMVAALRGDNKTAEDYYRKAIAADPGFPRVYRRLADLLYERGDFAKALANYQKTLTVEPDDFEAIVQAASSARHLGDTRTAADLFARAVRLRPDSWIPLYNQACLAAVEGDPPRALGLLQGLAGKRFPRLDLLEKDPDLTAVRRLPGYPPLLAQLKADRSGQGDEEEEEAM
ncbi:MAG TPA: sulfatase-like hydrolase/transferase [Thermoanaerobaculia bacterium]|jgi:arylsulfatase A-like enzyme/Flp pilus assembly protein TadD|nr:sulfatase-like hydrolase/transferase [Thermoanaerobaculia bacterium]